MDPVAPQPRSRREAPERARAEADVDRRPSVTALFHSGALDALDLAQLRGYRQQLRVEEEKVSYWRRLTHARIDMLEAGLGASGPLTIDDLVRVLGDTGSGRSRGDLVQTSPADPLPDLPDLTEMWDTEVDARDPEQVASALRRLHAAAHQLASYRVALHERIDESTRELILRYREDPSAALDALPQETSDL